MKKWYLNLQLTKLNKVENVEMIAPAFFTKGRIKKTWDILFLQYKYLFMANLCVGIALIPFLAFLLNLLDIIIEAESKFLYAMNTGIGWPLYETNNLLTYLAAIRDIRQMLIFCALLLLLPGPLFAGLHAVTYQLMQGVSEIKFIKVFLNGVKKHWWKYILIYTVFILILFGAVYLGFYNYEMTKTGESMVFEWIVFAIICLILLIYLMFICYSFPMIQSYDLKFKDILKNSILYVVGLFPINVLFAIIGGLPFLAFISGDTNVFLVVAVLIAIFIISVFALIFTSFATYGFENFLDPLYIKQLEEARRPQSTAGKKKDKKKTSTYVNPKKGKIKQ